VIVINLERRKGKLKRIYGLLNRTAFPCGLEIIVEHLNASTGQEVGLSAHPNWQLPMDPNRQRWRRHHVSTYWYRHIATGDMGCTASHLRAVQLVAASSCLGCRYLILEDDASWDSTIFVIRLQQSLQELEQYDTQWELLMLGIKAIPDRPQRKGQIRSRRFPWGGFSWESISPNVIIPGFFYRAQAYLISLSGAKKINGTPNIQHQLVSWDELLPAMAHTHPRRELRHYLPEINRLRIYATSTNWRPNRKNQEFLKKRPQLAGNQQGGRPWQKSTLTVDLTWQFGERRGEGEYISDTEVYL